MSISGFNNKKSLTISSSDVSANLSEFPVRISISNSAGKGDDDVSDILTEIEDRYDQLALEVGDSGEQCLIEANYLKQDKTVLLIHSDTTDGDTSFTDSSRSNHTVTAHDGVHHETDQHKLGATSIYFDGSGDYLSMSDDSTFDLEGLDFTIDFWCYFQTAPQSNGWETLASQWIGSGNSNNAWWIGINSSNNRRLTLFLRDSGGNRHDIVTNITPQAGQWYHIAVVRHGGNITFYVDGNDEGSVSISQAVNNSSHDVMIGAYNDGSAAYSKFDGYIDEFRIVKGEAKWTSNFMPPTEPYLNRDDSLELYARVPSVSASTDTALNFYYDSTYPSNRLYDRPYVGRGLTPLPSPRCTAWFTFHDADDSTVYDEVAGHNGTISGGSIKVGGPFGRYLDNEGSAANKMTLQSIHKKTFSAWIRRRNIGNYADIFQPTNNNLVLAIENNSNGNWIYIFNGSHNQFDVRIEDTEWHHIVLVQGSASNKWFCYVDNVKSSELTATFDDDIDVLGRHSNVSGQENVDFANVQIYREALTDAQVQELYEAGRVADNTVLLIHSDTTDGSTTFIDSAYNRHPIQVHGDVHHETDQAKFGTTSVYFDGAGDYLTSPVSDGFQFGNDDFTVDCWIYPVDTSSSKCIITRWDISGAHRSWKFNILNGKLHFEQSTTGSNHVNDVNGSTTITTNTWHHVAVVRSGDTITLFLDGVSDGSNTAVDIYSSDTDLLIGTAKDGGGNPGEYFNGYIDEIRISKGIARWTSDFTSPTAPYEDPTLYGNDQYTEFLLHSDTTDGSTAFIDSAYNRHPILVHGDVHHETDQHKFGATSIYFDGSGDYLTSPDCDEWDFEGKTPFTVDLWIYYTAIPSSYQFVVGYLYNWNTNYQWSIGFDNGNLGFFSSAGDLTHATPAANTWHHVEFSCDGSTWRLFFDGTLVESVSAASLSAKFSNSVLSIGQSPNGTAYNFTGYIDELRISRGIARHTSNFTPESAPYTSSGKHIKHHCTYTYLISPSGSYPDTDGVELRDTVKVSTDNSDYVGWDNTDGEAIKFDLWEVKDISVIKIAYVVATGSDVYRPTDITIKISDDDTTYTTARSFTPSEVDRRIGASDWSGHIFEAFIPIGKKCRYFTVSFTRGGQWTMFTEVECGSGYVGISGERVAQCVWDQDFLGVYHLAEDPGTGGACIVDSTLMRYHGTPNGNMDSTDLVTGPGGKLALDFDGSDDYIDIGDVFSGSNITLEADVNTTTSSSNDYIGIVTDTYPNRVESELCIDGSDNHKLKGGYFDGSWHTAKSSGAVNNGDDKYLAYTYNDSSNMIYVYVDGSQDGSLSTSAALPSETTNWRIGRRHDDGGPVSRFFDGELNEVRISKVARSEAWLAVTNLSNRDELLTWSAANLFIRSYLVEYYGLSGRIRSFLEELWEGSATPRSYLNEKWGMSLNSYLVQQYDIRRRVYSFLNIIYGMSLHSTLVQNYHDAAVIKSVLNQWWYSSFAIRSFLLEKWEDAGLARSEFEQLWTIYASPRSELVQQWLLSGGSVRGFLDEQYDLKLRDPVQSRLDESWALLSGSPIVNNHTISVTIDGQPLDIVSANIEASRSRYCITGSLTLADRASYNLCECWKEVLITINSTTYHMVIVSVSRQRQRNRKSYSESFNVELRSPAAKLDKPRARLLNQTFNTANLASVIVADLASLEGLSVDWEIVDWVIPAKVLVASSEPPIAVMRKITETAGAIIQSKPDGNLRVIYQYPIRVPDWPTVTPAYHLSDMTDFISSSHTLEEREGFNTVFVTDRETPDSSWQLECETVDEVTHIVRAWHVPLDETFQPALKTSGGLTVSITPLMVGTNNLHTELVPALDSGTINPVPKDGKDPVPRDAGLDAEVIEFIDGKGRTSKPIYGIASWEWQERDLGTLTYKESGDLTAAVPGQSLLKIKYYTKCYKWEVKSPDIDQVQFYIEE